MQKHARVDAPMHRYMLPTMLACVPHARRHARKHAREHAPNARQHARHHAPLLGTMLVCVPYMLGMMLQIMLAEMPTFKHCRNRTIAPQRTKPYHRNRTVAQQAVASCCRNRTIAHKPWLKVTAIVRLRRELRRRDNFLVPDRY